MSLIIKAYIIENIRWTTYICIRRERWKETIPPTILQLTLRVMK